MLDSFIIDFLVMFFIVYLIYMLFINKRKSDFALLNNNDQIKLFVDRYKLNIDKINYKYLVTIISLINSFILSLTCAIILRIDNILLSICVCFIIMFSLIFILFEIAGRYFKKLEKKVGKVKIVRTKNKSKKKEDE